MSDDRLEQHLAAGRSAVLVIDSEDALPGNAEIKATIRAGSEYDGRWFSNFNWIRAASAPFREVAFGRILGFESLAVVPNYVIEQLKPADFDDVLSGATFGWIHNNSALAMQLLVAEGRLLATTFRFEGYGIDAYATALLDALLRYMRSGQCQPKLRLRLNAEQANKTAR